MEKGSHMGHLQELLLGFPYELMYINTFVYTHAFLTLPLHISSAFLNTLFSYKTKILLYTLFCDLHSFDAYIERPEQYSIL